MEETNKNNDTTKIIDKEQSKNYSDFLGEYKNEFEDIKLIKKVIIYKIYRAKNIKDNRKVCLKVFDKHILQKGDYDFFLEPIKREEEIVKLCKSQFIVNIYRKLETSHNIILEMDYWDSNFDEIIKKKGGFLNRMIFYQKIFWEILNALKVLNKNQIIHRDIKPSNLFFIADNITMIQKPCVKLGGFDYAIYTKDNTSESVGSYFYAAPEIIKNLEYDEKCDLWSFGITLYELLFEKLPYGRNVTINLIKQSIYYEDNFHYDKTNNDFFN